MKVSSVVSVLSTAVLVSATESGTPTSSSSASQQSCLPAGSTDAQGRYACNPAHQYPDGKSCKSVDGCPILVDANGKPLTDNGPASTVSHETPVATPTCLPAGSTDSKGHYSCNPAHQYPDGKSCKSVDGCPILVDANGKPLTDNGPASTVSHETANPTPTCLPGGSTDSKGRYSCNPAHAYPDGKTCKIVDGCPFLCDAHGNVLTDNGAATTVVHPPAQTSLVTSCLPKTECPPAGTTDSKGRYACNPAHQYPNGQVCVIIDGCPVLCGSDKQPIKNTATHHDDKPVVTDHPKPTDNNGKPPVVTGNVSVTDGHKPTPTDHNGKPPVVTAGASALQGAGVLAIAAFALLL